MHISRVLGAQLFSLWTHFNVKNRIVKQETFTTLYLERSILWKRLSHLSSISLVYIQLVWMLQQIWHTFRCDIFLCKHLSLLQPMDQQDVWQRIRIIGCPEDVWSLNPCHLTIADEGYEYFRADLLLSWTGSWDSNLDLTFILRIMQ